MNEIGRRLRATREAKGLSLAVVEEETKIRRKYVEALETGEEAVLPGDAYLKGFLRTYGNYLGLDGTALVDEYKRSKERSGEAPAPATPRPAAAHRDEPAADRRATPTERRRPEPREQPPVREYVRSRAEHAAATEPVVERPAARPASRPRRKVGKQASGLRTVGAAAIVLALVGAVSYLGWLVFSQSAPAPKEPDLPATPPPVASTQPEPTPPPKQPDPPKVTMSQPNASDAIFLVPAKEIVVVLEAGDRGVWYQSTIDGKTDSATLAAGATKEFKGADIRIYAGHMEGVSLVVNGTRFEKPLKGGPNQLTFKSQ